MSTKTPIFYGRDRADNTWIECPSEAHAARMVERAKGDWTDPAIGYGILVQFDGEPERVYTATEVKAMLRNLAEIIHLKNGGDKPLRYANPDFEVDVML